MAAGKAIVATAQNQAAEVIRDGQTGRLVEAGNANAFADAVLTLLNDTVERTAWGRTPVNKLLNDIPGSSTPGGLKRYISVHLGIRHPDRQ